MQTKVAEAPEQTKSLVDIEKLSLAVRVKRGERSFRETEEDTGLSFKLLYRVEVEKLTPGLDNYIRICRWLQMPMEYFTINEETNHGT